MTAPDGSTGPGVEIHRLGRDGRNAVYWILGIFGVILGALVVLAFLQPSARAAHLLAIFACWAAATAFAVFRTRQMRLEIFADGFRYVGFFRTSALRYEDIAGYRHAVGRYGGRSAEFLGVLCDSGGTERVRVTSYLERPKQVREWIQEHFRDLDAVDLAEERRMVKSREVAARLSLVRGLATIVNVLGTLLAFLVLLGSAVGVVGPRWVLIGGALLAMPIAALALRARYGQLVSFETPPYRSRFGKIELGLLVPMLAAWMMAACAPPVHTAEAVPWAIAIGVLFFLGLRRWGGRLLGNAFTAVFFGLLSLSYGYGMTCFANAALDRGDPAMQSVVIQSRSERRGSVTVRVSMPAEEDVTHRLEVQKQLGDMLSPGRPAIAFIKPGALGIPWIAAVGPAP